MIIDPSLLSHQAEYRCVYEVSGHDPEPLKRLSAEFEAICDRKGMLPFAFYSSPSADKYAKSQEYRNRGERLANWIIGTKDSNRYLEEVARNFVEIESSGDVGLLTAIFRISKPVTPKIARAQLEGRNLTYLLLNFLPEPEAAKRMLSDVVVTKKTGGSTSLCFARTLSGFLEFGGIPMIVGFDASDDTYFLGEIDRALH